MSGAYPFSPDGTPPANGRLMMADSPTATANGLGAYQNGRHWPVELSMGQASPPTHKLPRRPPHWNESVLGPSSLVELMEDSWFGFGRDSPPSFTFAGIANGNARAPPPAVRALPGEPRFSSSQSISANSRDGAVGRASARGATTARNGLHLQPTPMLPVRDGAAPSAVGASASPRLTGGGGGEQSPTAVNRRISQTLERWGLGSWIGRQQRFDAGGAAPMPAEAPAPAPAAAPKTEPARGGKRGERQQRLSRQSSRTSEEGDEEEDAARQAAWRWRFNRRWAQEQAKQLDPEYGRGPEDVDGWDEALGYLDACGPGWHLQVARTVSSDTGLAGTSGVSGSDLSPLLLADSHRDGMLGSRGDMDATKSLVSVARRAQDLCKQQEVIEREVSARWDFASSGGVAWAGHQVPAVRIGVCGRFEFALVKLVDRGTGLTKLLVRGKNFATEAQLLQALREELRDVFAQRGMQPPAAVLIGAGVMEWARERDRVIIVQAGKLVAGADPSITSKADVARLAAGLTQASLPMNYRVVSER